MSFLTLISKPKLVVMSFVGKVAGSVVGNPNKLGRTGGTTTPGAYSSLFAPSAIPIPDGNALLTQNNIDSVMYLDSNLLSVSSTGNMNITQHLFSFNLIDGIDRAVGPGTVKKSTTADKVTWLKNNLSRVRCNWSGYGSGPSGNKVSLARWRTVEGRWDDAVSNTTGVVSGLSLFLLPNAILFNTIDSDGFIHFLAYADASDGTTASTVNTDYVELAVYLK